MSSNLQMPCRRPWCRSPHTLPLSDDSARQMRVELWSLRSLEFSGSAPWVTPWENTSDIIHRRTGLTWKKGICSFGAVKIETCLSATAFNASWVLSIASVSDLMRFCPCSSLSTEENMCSTIPCSTLRVHTTTHCQHCHFSDLNGHCL